MSQLSDQHLAPMVNAARSLGIPLGELKPVNPFTQQGARAEQICMALEVTNPVAAAQLKAEAGLSFTLETAAVRAGVIEMTQSAHTELMISDADYIQRQQEQAVQKEQDLLASMERMTAESHRKRLVNQLGSEDAADRAMFAEEQREKSQAQEAQLAADRHRELQQRIAQKQAEIQRGFEIARASATGVMPQ